MCLTETPCPVGVGTMNSVYSHPHSHSRSLVDLLESDDAQGAVATARGGDDSLLPMTTLLGLGRGGQDVQFPLMFNDALPAKSTAPEAHDDMCLNSCTGVGVYNGANNFNHRGAQASYRNMGGPSLSQMHGPLHHLPSHMHPQAFYLDPSQQEAWMGSRMLDRRYQDERQRPAGQDHDRDEDHSHGYIHDDLFPATCSIQDDGESCCNSECTMTNKCTNTACEDKADACTDRTCPERPVTMNPDDAHVAATLMGISHGQEQHQHQHQHQHHNQPQPQLQDLSYGLYPYDNTFADIMSLSTHIETSHGNRDLLDCVQECPLLSPAVWQRCAFPTPTRGGAVESFNPYNPLGSSGGCLPPGFAICGAETTSPNDLIHHYFDAHSADFRGHHGPQFDLAPAAAPAPAHAPAPAPQALQKTAQKVSSPRCLTVNTEAREAGSTVSAETPSSGTPGTPRKSPFVVSSPASIVTTPGWEFTCFWCDGDTECGSTFHNSKELNDHVVQEHVRNLGKVDDCFHCGWRDCPRAGLLEKPGFVQRSKLERHMQTHVGHKPHQCDRCGQDFSGKQALMQHMLAHDGQRPLECKICGKTFTYKSSLTMHVRTHTKEKPLQCPECGKRFSESSNLSKHKRIHETLARYACQHPGCDKRFNRLDQLRRHKKTKHDHRDGASDVHGGVADTSHAVSFDP